MPNASRFASVVTRPRNEFDSISRASALAQVPMEDDFRARLFDLPLLAVVVDAEAHPVWLPTLFLAEVALGTRSVTGDTVRTYAEALLPWLRYVEDRNIALEDVTGLYRANLTHKNRDHCSGNYASATIKQRVVVPVPFHAWGQRRGLMLSPLGSYLTTGDGATIWRMGMRRGHYRSARISRIATPRIIKRSPVALTHEEVARVSYHFEHVHRAITDGYYVGSDIELQKLLNEEARIDLAQGLTDLLSATHVGGKAGATSRMPPPCPRRNGL